MKKQTSLLLALALTTATVANAAEQLSLEDRVAELEAERSLNIFSFSGTFSTRYDGFSSKQNTAASQYSSYHSYLGGAYDAVYAGLVDKPAYDEKSTSVLREKFNLNINAKVSPTINFYSRITMSKRMNGFVKQSAPSSSVTDDLTQSNSYTDSKAYVEKAYADVRLPDGNTVFSFGRLPTTEGTPTQYWNAQDRMGTYPMLSYNSPLDGFALTYNWKNLLGTTNHDLATRIIYTPFTNTNYGKATTGGGYISNPTEGSTGNKVPTQTDAVAFQIDYSSSALGFARNFGVIAQYLSIAPFHFNNGASALANQTTGYVDPSDLKLSLQSSSLTLEADGIANTGLDIAATYYMSQVKTKGTIYAFINGVTTGTSSPSVGYLPLGGYGCSISSGQGCDKTFTGNVILVSTRYNFGNTFLGAEYVKGSKNVFYFDGAGENLTSFYSTPGTGVHAYVTHKFDSNLSGRIGYMTQDYDYSGMGYGQESLTSDRQIKTTYANLRLDF